MATATCSAPVSDRVPGALRGPRGVQAAGPGPGEVAEKYGIPGHNYADFAALRGDPSDGLPGVTGIGERTATALVTRFGSIEQIVAAAQADEAGFPAGARAKILAALDYLAVAPAVVRSAPTRASARWTTRCPQQVADPQRLLELSDEYGLDSSINRVLRAVGITVCSSGRPARAVSRPPRPSSGRSTSTG